MKEIDSEIIARCNKLEKEESGILMTIQIGGGYGKDDLAKFDEDVDEECEYWGAEVADVEHLDAASSRKRGKRLMNKLPNWT